jgi:hypothetical protein
MAESFKETDGHQAESLIDDVIRDIFTERGAPSETSMAGMATTAALLETAFGSMRGASRTSTLERVLLAEAFASELAEALAPALAEQLAPRLMKALEHLTTAEAAGKKPASAARSGGQGNGKPASAARSGGQGRRPRAKSSGPDNA